MIIIAGLLGGAVWGVYLAKKRGGNRLDMAQYGAGFAIAFGLVALFVTLGLDRLI